jgi:hypothetical protein
VGALVPAPPGTAAALARLLDLPRCEDLAAGVVGTGGADAGEDADDDEGAQVAATPPAARAVAPGVPGTWLEHEDLHVDGVPVDWWVEGHGPEATVHASHVAALARGLAQAAGAWPVRHALEVALTEPGRVPDLVTEAMLDPS